MSIAFISHADCALHNSGDNHPECPGPLAAIEDQILASRLDLVLRRYDAPLATREQICRVHGAAYVDEIFRKARHSERVWLDPDTWMNEHSLNAALRAAGGPVLGVELAMTRKDKAVFCCVRPPGHHAEANHAMGFCIFNNVCVGAAHALHEYELDRVAILDFDVHHGNGTENIFAGNRRVLYCSTFQHPFYPHTGTDLTADNIVNVPLPAGTSGGEFRAAVAAHWLPRLESFRPQLVFVSAGFDAHIEDEMAEMRLREEDYAWVTEAIRDIAERHAEGRIVSVLEGGYALPALGRSVAAHLNALLG